MRRRREVQWWGGGGGGRVNTSSTAGGAHNRLHPGSSVSCWAFVVSTAASPAKGWVGSRVTAHRSCSVSTGSRFFRLIDMHTPFTAASSTPRGKTTTTTTN